MHKPSSIGYYLSFKKLSTFENCQNQKYCSNMHFTGNLRSQFLIYAGLRLFFLTLVRTIAFSHNIFQKSNKCEQKIINLKLY